MKLTVITISKLHCTTKHHQIRRFVLNIGVHGLKIQERRYLMFFAKIPNGGSRLSGKIAWGGPPISGFITFLLTSVLKFA
jgi:hypothetical protein